MFNNLQGNIEEKPTPKSRQLQAKSSQLIPLHSKY